MRTNQIRHRVSAITWLAALMFAGAVPAAIAASFVNGADVGWLSQFESLGVKWRNPSGVQQDVLQSLAEQGVNAVRLRVFVNPPANGMSGGYPIGFCDPASVVNMAVRAKKAGLTRIMIDFHYSDGFADPGKQNKPAAWSGDTFSQLLDDVTNHTHDVMAALAAAGVYPQWVQIGNEINGGMLWPDGDYAHFNQLTQLINRGYDAVKAVSPSSKVVIHLANGYDNGTFRSWFDAFGADGGKWDVIGASYYPSYANVDYTQDIAAVRSNLADMAARYGKEVMVCEVGGPEGNPDNTHDLVAATIAAVKAVPDGKGLGVFYWEPESNMSVSGYGLGATTRLAPNDLQFTRVVTAYATPKPAQVTVGPTDGTNQMINLSTRGVAESGENALIGGFYIGGVGTKRVLIRGVADTLLQFTLTSVLRQPVLTLYDANRQVIKTATILDTYVNASGGALAAAAYVAPPNQVQIRPDLVQAGRQVGAFDLSLPAWATQPQLANAALYAQGDAVMIADLAPGLYSVAISPDPATTAAPTEPALAPYNTSGNSGLVLLEIYDMAPNSGSRFTNLSTRGKIETGDRQMIVGFVMIGSGHRRVLVRGIGPTLRAFGVSGAVDDSAVELFDASSTGLVANDDWGLAPWADQTATLSPSVGAFGLSPTSLDGAILTQLAPGRYSAIISSMTGQAGVGLAEIYECP